MSLIRINIDEVRRINVQLRNNTSDLGVVKKKVSALRYSLDSRVLGRRNIEGRINSVANSLNSIEAKFENLQLFLNKAMDRYLEADDKVRNTANTISKPREKTSSLLNINLFKAFSDIKKSVQKEFKMFEKDANEFIKELDKFAEKTWKNIEMDEKYAEIIGTSLFKVGKLEWEKYKKDDPIMAGIKVGVLETVKSMTVDLVVGIFGQVKGIIKDPLKKAKEYGELFETINAVILPLTPADQVISDKVYNGIWTEVKNGFEKDIINGDAYTRSKYLSSVVSTIATFFVGVGEVKAAATGGKVAEVAKVTEETAKVAEIAKAEDVARVAKLEGEARIAKLAKAEEDAKKAEEITKTSYEKSIGNSFNPSDLELKISDKKAGQKLTQHLREDFKMDPSDIGAREWIKNHTEDIHVNAEEIRTNSWRAIGDKLPNGLKGEGPALFYKKGNDVVVTELDGNFITILKDGAISNKRFIEGTILWKK